MSFMRSPIVLVLAVAGMVANVFFFVTAARIISPPEVASVAAPIVVLLDPQDDDASHQMAAVPEHLARAIVLVHGPYPPPRDQVAEDDTARLVLEEQRRRSDAAYEEFAGQLQRIEDVADASHVDRVVVIGPHTTSQTEFVLHYLDEHTDTSLDFHATTSSAIVREQARLHFAVADNRAQAEALLAEAARGGISTVVLPSPAYLDSLQQRGANTVFLRDLTRVISTREGLVACTVDEAREVARSGCVAEARGRIVAVLPDVDAAFVLRSVGSDASADATPRIIAPDSWNKSEICAIARQWGVELTFMRPDRLANDTWDPDVPYATQAVRAALDASIAPARARSRADMTWEGSTCP